MPPTSMPVPTTAGLINLAQEDNGDGTRSNRFAPQVDGKAVDSNNPLPVEIAGGIQLVPAGSTGVDYSVNRPLPPTGTPLQTIPADPTRAAIEVINIGSVPVTLVRDDGNGNNLSIIPLAAADSPTNPGGSWPSTTFRGRLRVYGPANAIVTIFKD